MLSAQLNIELPRFLSSVSRYFNIIISHFAAAQATYHEAVHSAWTGFADHWFVQIPAGQYGAIESSFANSHSPVAEMMDTLAAGLGVTPARESLSLSLEFRGANGSSLRSSQVPKLQPPDLDPPSHRLDPLHHSTNRSSALALNLGIWRLWHRRQPQAERDEPQQHRIGILDALPHHVQRHQLLDDRILERSSHYSSSSFDWVRERFAGV